MKVIKKLSQTVLAAVVLSCLLFSVRAMASPAGEVDFGDLSKYYGEAKVEVNLGASLIGLVSMFAREEDPEVAKIMSTIESVKVRVYTLNKNSNKAVEMVDSITKRIRKDKWEPIVSINEDNEKVRIFIKMTDEKIDGLVVMAIDNSRESGEAVFVNIVGEIDPANIATVTKSLNIKYGDQK
ncbi:MAG: hypothetical protein ACI93R_002981 [Flavobacteriales bacterium]|jgi:hypothetical protein